MKKINITERGQLAGKLNQKEYFYSDLALYRKYFPGSKLNNELARVNDFNQARLHSKIIYELLGVAGLEEIEQNRQPSPAIEPILDVDVIAGNPEIPGEPIPATEPAEPDEIEEPSPAIEPEEPAVQEKKTNVKSRKSSPK